MKRYWLVGGFGAATLAAIAVVLAGGDELAPRNEAATAKGARLDKPDAAAVQAVRAITVHPAAPSARRSLDPDARVVRAAEPPARRALDRDAWFDARAVGFERAQRDALEAVALDDAELQVLLAAAAKERAGVDAVSAAALASIRAGAAPPERFDLSGVERPLEALLGDRYPTYVLIWLRATVEEFDAIDEGCGDAGCE